MKDSKINAEIKRLEEELEKGREIIANSQRQMQNLTVNCLRIEGAIANLKSLQAPEAPQVAKEAKA